MEIAIAIYLIGYITFYYIIKKLERNRNEWSRVWLCFVVDMFSWLGIIAYIYNNVYSIIHRK